MLPGTDLFWILNVKMIFSSLYECQKACNVNKSLYKKKNPRIIFGFADADHLKLFPQHVPTMLCNLH